MRVIPCLLVVLVTVACARNPAASAPVAARDTVYRDSAVKVERVSGLSFVAPTGIARLVPTPDSLTMHEGESLPSVVVSVEGRSATDRPIAVPVPLFIMAKSPVARLSGGYIRALHAGTTTLYVLYDPSFADSDGVPRDDPGVAKVRIRVEPR